MNAKLLKRLVQSITLEDEVALKQIAETIVQDETKKGHTKLARELEDIIYKNSNKNRKNNSIDAPIVKGMTTLPVSRRHNQSLATIIEHDGLKHHMVLANHIEKRFDKIEREYASKERLLKFNLKPRSKILLYGPPGCGKTLGAERLAWNLGLPLMKVKFDAIISSYFGESAANLRAIFEASAKSPCVLLLDECDFIAKSRTLGQDVGEVPRIVNMLLMLLDEYDAPGLIVGTTNLEKSLDNALFRRFDEVIEMPKPSKNEILKLLKTTLSAFKVEDNLNWDMIVEKLKGQSYANIVKIAENAAKSSILEGNKIVASEYIEMAISEIIKH